MKKQASLSAMKSRRRNVSESPQTIRRRSSRLSSDDELLLNIPIELIIEIFSRLTLKSIARCRCVSKRWASVLRSPDFTKLFLAKSLARPQILFVHRNIGKNEAMFSSGKESENVSSFIAAEHHVSFPVESDSYISSPVNGYLCLSDDRILKGRKKTRELVWVICNPSTGQSFALPKMKTKKMTGSRRYLVYDHVEKQHRVLAMTCEDEGGAVEHQVLTLRGTRNLTWRRIECGIPHSFPSIDSICISGVLYYTAYAFNGEYMMVCFDVRSEKFSFVNFTDSGMYDATLINFQGKLASVRSTATCFLNGRSTSFEVWILQDPETHEWSKRIFSLPPMGKDASAIEYLYFIGVSATNEFVISPLPQPDPFHVYYYNFVKESIRRVEIQGLGAFQRGSLAGIFLNHVADVKLM